MWSCNISNYLIKHQSERHIIIIIIIFIIIINLFFVKVWIITVPKKLIKFNLKT